MRLEFQFGLLFVALEITQDKNLYLPKMLLDTGSSSTLISAQRLLEIGVTYEMDDPLYTVRGVGGTETVFAKRLQRLRLGTRDLSNFEVQVSAVDYGIPMDGILGLDVLQATGAIIDLAASELRFQTA